jgi:hypothetical protein
LKPKRGYSKDFPVTDRAANFYLGPIPAGFWRAVRAKAKRDGLSMRALILGLLQTWLNEGDAK